MNWMIYNADGEVVNTIVASENFVESYCAKNGYTYEKMPDPAPPDPEPETETTARLREEAYNTEAIIEWDGEMITVTAASQLWQYYAAEGSPKAEELQALIAQAKANIRERYPDIEGAT